MKILGIDPATNSGWALIEDDRLLDYGCINPNVTMTMPQKINYYYNEINRLMDRLDFDYCAIEDLIMGISGTKVLIGLSRINTCGVLAAVKHIPQNRIKVYKPTYWKANSFNGLNGSSKKWEIQWAACETYNLFENNAVIKNQWKDKIIDLKKIFLKQDEKINNIKLDIEDCKRKLARKKRDVLQGEARNLVQTKLTMLQEKKKEETKVKTELKKNSDKQLAKISVDLQYRTGISTDIADAIGVAICLQKELNFQTKG